MSTSVYMWENAEPLNLALTNKTVGCTKDGHELTYPVEQPHGGQEVSDLWIWHTDVLAWQHSHSRWGTHNVPSTRLVNKPRLATPLARCSWCSAQHPAASSFLSLAAPQPQLPSQTHYYELSKHCRISYSVRHATESRPATFDPPRQRPQPYQVFGVGAHEVHAERLVDSRPVALGYSSAFGPPCPGICLPWEGEDFWIDYPFHIHSNNSKFQPGYRVVNLDPPRICSVRCRGTPNGMLPCSRCSDLHVEVDVVKDKARRGFGSVRTEGELTHTQLHAKLAASKETVNELKLKKSQDSDAADAAAPRTPQFCGHTLSFDEIAIERRIDYMPTSDQMAGFCLEHLKSSGLETVKVGSGIEVVEAAVAAVKEGKVHIAHETCVGAISHLSETNYGAKPVFMGPTCKKGTWQDTLRTIQIVLEAWKCSPDGAPKHGPALSVSTDGDPGRRAALFMLCMHDEIRPGNPIYDLVKNLPGLNLRVGKDNLTGDSDYKHDFKRVRGLLCSEAGLTVNDVCVNRDLLSLWLERLSDHDWSETSIHVLLDPGDSQHVARAIQLLMCIVEIGKLDPEEFDPSEQAELEALKLLRETFDAMLQPFINTNLSLSEQIESLVKFSHLLCGLYLQNGTSFMSNQLYADLQTMVKNAILMVPKTCLINGELKVFLCLLGDDVLEALFGRCRMIGGHSPNCSVCKLRDRFGSAMNLDSVYEKHPELERKPQRLKLLRARDVDHLRPPDFGRELRASSCNVEQCYVAGVISAEFILRRYGVKLPAVTFHELFKRKNTDLLRPFGGKYPAISTEVDRSMTTLSSPTSLDMPTMGLDANPSPGHLLRDIDFDAMFASEKAECAEAAAVTSHSVFAKIDEDGHLTHKKSVCRTLFDMTPDNHSSTDRLLRVRGFTVGGKSWIREDTRTEAMSASTHFQLGHIFATLICYDAAHLGLGIAKCTLIKRGPPNSKSPSISAVPLAELSLPTSPYSVYGQILSLRPITTDASTWAWTGDFVSLSLKKKATIDTGNEKTWVFSNQDVLSAWNCLWNWVNSDPSLHVLLTECFRIKLLSIADRTTCRLCKKPVKDADRQNHTGRHILKALRGVSDPALKVPVSNSYPCGMCGGPSSHSACQIRIKGGKADSDCRNAYSFQIQAASIFQDSRPCTNIPILCPLNCNETHWKYNLPQHFSERHPSWKQLLPPDFVSRIRIGRAEELALGIPTEKVVEWPDSQLPTSQSSSDDSRGSKRPGEDLQRSPRRRNKENEDPRLLLGNKTARLHGH
ncbi:hypothetical protein B0H10DRAFT_1941439 [Mycena sp. CBHHK59/15]|nr:hypothetical protein B0H10DRAFT_1941439 [Mycena sp. CBHHK59/15]